ncbi:hypothetical protein [Sphingosinicella sp.]|uniref:hypothetical protein n=1 Tax=Sphingosinicella sp. TaxID=1917971 RepID=UPI0040381EC5
MRNYVFVSIFCALQASVAYTQTPAPGGAPTERVFDNPVPAEKVVYFNPAGERVEAYWGAIPRAERGALLNSAEAFVQILQVDGGGNVSILPVTASVRRGNYRMLFRWQQYRSDSCRPNNPAAGQVRTGVALEIQADIQTSRDGVNIASFLGLSAGVDRERVSGQLRIRQIGLGNSSPTLGTYLTNFAMTREGLTKALEAIAVTKAVLENPNTVLTPHYLSVYEQSPGSCDPVLPTDVQTQMRTTTASQ